MSDEREYLTKEKYAELALELEHLKKVERKSVAEALESAKALGDLSENAEYHDARAKQGNLEDRISQIENVLKNAEIMSLHHTTVVGVGSTVVVQKKGDKEKNTYKIVGSEEANAADKKISFKSPFGMAIMGKQKGDDFEVSAPKGDISYKVIDVE